eukprot:s762_g12.t1
MGSEKELLGLSELGCADGCGRRGCKGVGQKEPHGAERDWMRGRLRTAWVRAWMRGRLRGAREWVGGWEEGAAGDERARMRGRLRKAWVQGSGWKWVGKGNRWG